MSYFEPIHLDGTRESVRTYFPDPRLTPSRVWTIEVLFALDRRNPQTGQLPAGPARQVPYCVVSQGDASTVNYSILVDADGAAIGMANQDTADFLPFVFEDGEPHQVAFVVYGAFTEVIIDGLTRGFLKLGCGTSPDLPLHIGSSDGVSDRFQGLVYAVRLWRRGLRPSEVMAAETSGRPKPEHPAFADLVAFTIFTEDEEELNYTKPFRHITAPVGGAGGGGFVLGVQPGQRLTGLQVVPNENGIRAIDAFVPAEDGRTERIVEIEARRRAKEVAAIREAAPRRAVWAAANAVELALPGLEAKLTRFEAQGPGFLALGGAWREYLLLPGLKRELDLEDGPRRQQASDVLARFAGTAAVTPPGERPLLTPSTTEGMTLNAPEAVAVRTLLQELLATIDAAAAGQITVPIEDPPVDLGFEPGVPNVALGRGETIVGFVATYDSVFRTLRFITNLGISQRFGARQPGAAEQSRVVQLPAGGLCTGVYGTRSEEGLHSLGLTFILTDDSLEFRWSPNHLLAPPSIDLGRFLPVTAFGPVLNDAVPSLELHGNYEMFLAGSGASPAPARAVGLKMVLGSRDLLLAEEGAPSPRLLRRRVGDTYREVDTTNDLTFEPDGTFAWLGKRYRNPGPYPRFQPDDNEILPWGGTFNSNERPTLAEFNFMGYNITSLDPRNFQIGTGTSRMVFAFPDDTGREYTVSSTGRIIPHGLVFRPDEQSLESVHTVVARSEQEHHRAWNANVGFSVGVPEAASFGLNADYKESLDRMSSREQSVSISKATQVEYALVLDRARARLSDDFRNEVLRLRDRSLASVDVNFSEFVSTFGTHYPYAVTYGGVCYQEISYTVDAEGELRAKGFNISGHASGTLEGVTLGLSGGGGMEWSDGLKQEMERQESTTSSVGGSISFGGGWSLPARSEVPVFLDLRPLDELLTPLYFDDAFVSQVLRLGVKNEIARLTTGFSLSDRRTDPLFVTITLEGLQNTTRTFIDGTEVSAINDVAQQNTLVNALSQAGQAIADFFGLGLSNEIFELFTGAVQLGGSIVLEGATKFLSGSGVLFDRPGTSPEGLEHNATFGFPGGARTITAILSRDGSLVIRGQLFDVRSHRFRIPLFMTGALELTPEQLLASERHTVRFAGPPQAAPTRIEPSVVLTFSVKEI